MDMKYPCGYETLLPSNTTKE